MNENLLVKVDAEKGQVACLPKYQNNGLPYFYINSVLPTMSVNDPMPNVRKMCYVKKYKKNICTLLMLSKEYSIGISTVSHIIKNETWREAEDNNEICSPV